MGAFTYIETDTGTNVDISAATAVGAYTSTGDKLIMVDVSIDAVAGNGDYVMYVTRQIGGAGSAYVLLPKTTMAAASGETAIGAQSGWITVRNGDVLTCYVDGLAGDTSTPDWSTRWYELAGVTAAAIADAVLDEAVADHTGAGSLSKAVTDTLEDTGTTIPATLTTIDDFIDTEVAAILAAVDTEVAAIKAKTDNLPASPAAVGSAMTLTAAYDKAKDDVLTPLGVVDGVVDAVKAKTDLIPATPAVADEYDAALAAIQSDLDNPDQYKADVSGLATQASVNAIPTTPLLEANYTAPDNASIAAILEDTGTTIPATLAGLATSAEVGAIALLGETVIGSYTVQDILKILAAKMVGKATGGGTTTIKYRGVDDSTDVVVETVDSNGNRSAVTLTV